MPVPHEPERCPMCGSPVCVVSGGEGTAHYEPESERRTTPSEDAVDCPVCGAPKGYPCNADVEGEVRIVPHIRRIWAANSMPAPVHREEGKG